MNITSPFSVLSNKTFQIHLFDTKYFEFLYVTYISFFCVVMRLFLSMKSEKII